MTKHILKVALITVLSTLAVFVFVVMAIAVAAPSRLAKIYSDLGFEKRAKVYAEIAYKNSESIDDLVFLVKTSSLCGDDSATSKYSEILLNREDFASYAASHSGEENLYDEVASEYVKACYRLKKLQTAELCAAAMKYSVEYRKSNAVEALMVIAYENGDKACVSELKNVLTAFAKNCPEQSRNRFLNDLVVLDKMIEKLN